MIGASADWLLSDDKDFDGKVLVVDRDLSYENTSTMNTHGGPFAAVGLGNSGVAITNIIGDTKKI